jgi:signal peptidase I
MLKPHENRRKPWYRDWSESLLWAVIMALIIRSLLIQAFKIPSGSMEDTLLVGDFLMVNKFIYGTKIPFTDVVILPGIRQPQPGDIIVFKYPLDGRDFIKRCVAVEGDTVEVIGKDLYVNGKRPDEPYVVHKAWESSLNRDAGKNIWRQDYQKAWEERKFVQLGMIRDNFGPVVIPKGSIFAMGDNRDNSLDSRFWGPLPKNLLRGQALFIYWSWDSENGEAFWKFWKNIRFTRLGDLIK